MIKLESKSCGNCGDCCNLLEILQREAADPAPGIFRIGVYIQDCHATHTICYNAQSKRWEYWERFGINADKYPPVHYAKSITSLIKKLKVNNYFDECYPKMLCGVATTILLYCLIK